MKLSIRQSYLAMFFLLDGFYDITKDDCLGSLLSGFNPYLFVDSMSADPAAWGDWKNIVIKVTDADSLTSGEAFRATFMFVKFHKEEFGFELDWLINELSILSEDSENWSSSVNQALLAP